MRMTVAAGPLRMQAKPTQLCGRLFGFPEIWGISELERWARMLAVARKIEDHRILVAILAKGSQDAAAERSLRQGARSKPISPQD